MINVITKEYSEEGKAYYKVIVKIFGIPIYKKSRSTTNKEMVITLSDLDYLKIKGFSYENKN